MTDLKKVDRLAAIDLAVAYQKNDVPSFLNVLQFNVLRFLPELRRGGVPEIERVSGLRDSKLDILHALGKFLWNKRVADHKNENNGIGFNKETDQNNGCQSYRVFSNRRPNLPSYARRYGCWLTPFFQLSDSEIIERLAILQQPQWVESQTSRQLDWTEMIPKIFRPPLYFDSDALLDSLASDLPHLVNLMHSNFPYFYREEEDSAEFLDQLSYADAMLRVFPNGQGNEYSFSDTWAIVACKAVLDSNLHPHPPSRIPVDTRDSNTIGQTQRSDSSDKPMTRFPITHGTASNGTALRVTEFDESDLGTDWANSNRSSPQMCRAMISSNSSLLPSPSISCPNSRDTTFMFGVVVSRNSSPKKCDVRHSSTLEEIRGRRILEETSMKLKKKGKGPSHLFQFDRTIRSSPLKETSISTIAAERVKSEYRNETRNGYRIASAK